MTHARIMRGHARGFRAEAAAGGADAWCGTMTARGAARRQELTKAADLAPGGREQHHAHKCPQGIPNREIAIWAGAHPRGWR